MLSEHKFSHHLSLRIIATLNCFHVSYRLISCVWAFIACILCIRMYTCVSQVYTCSSCILVIVQVFMCVYVCGEVHTYMCMCAFLNIIWLLSKGVGTELTNVLDYFAPSK